jgi:hypothetical protein
MKYEFQFCFLIPIRGSQTLSGFCTSLLPEMESSFAFAFGDNDAPQRLSALKLTNQLARGLCQHLAHAKS